jgi:hypothetical protein
VSESVDKEKAMTRKNIASLAIAVLIGIVIQAGFIALDCTNTPSDIAVSYAKAYYKLCPSMAQYLCGTSSEKCCQNKETCSKNESATCANTGVEDYIYNATADAAQRGFKKNFTKYTLYHIETHTEYLDDSTAVVHLTAHKRLSINPLYAYVARLFDIGDTYEVDEHIRVKHEGGSWRVCASSLHGLKSS